MRRNKNMWNISLSQCRAQRTPTGNARSQNQILRLPEKSWWIWSLNILSFINSSIAMVIITRRLVFNLNPAIWMIWQWIARPHDWAVNHTHKIPEPTNQTINLILWPDSNELKKIFSLLSCYPVRPSENQCYLSLTKKPWHLSIAIKLSLIVVVKLFEKKITFLRLHKIKKTYADNLETTA